MKADQYSGYNSVKVKARANYLCQRCGSDHIIQAHAPNGDHTDWRKGIALCGDCHANEHPSVPRSLFLSTNNQPCWPNISANALAQLFCCHTRTVIRHAKKLDIPMGVALSNPNKAKLQESLKGSTLMARRIYDFLNGD